MEPLLTSWIRNSLTTNTNKDLLAKLLNYVESDFFDLKKIFEIEETCLFEEDQSLKPCEDESDGELFSQSSYYEDSIDEESSEFCTESIHHDEEIKELTKTYHSLIDEVREMKASLPTHLLEKFRESEAMED